MWQSYKQLLQLIFPPSADERALQATPTQHFASYAPRVHHGTVTLLPYRDHVVRAAIHLAKFHHHPLALERLGSALLQYCQHHPHDLIIPVPLGAKRERARGYNQVLEIVRAAQKTDQAVQCNSKLLVRTKHTRPQTELTRAARQKNLIDAFAVIPRHAPPDIRHLNIVLLDDVVTTGSTMKAARAALAPLKPRSITCVALAG